MGEQDRLREQIERIERVGQKIAIEIPGMEAHIEEVRERSFVRHALARHIETNNYARVRELRRKHGM